MGSLKNDFDDIWKQSNMGLERLIFINIAIFIIIIFGDLFFKKWSGLTPWLSLSTSNIDFIFRPWTLITSFFTHREFFDLAFNLFWLYFFGRIFNDLLGSDKLIALYILSGLITNISLLVLIRILPIYISPYILGASSSIFAILTATTSIAPDYKIQLFLIGPVKIKYILFIAIGIAVFQTLEKKELGYNIQPFLGVGIGYFYIKFLRNGNDYGQWITNYIHQMSVFFSNKKQLKVTYNKFKEDNIKKKKNSSNAQKKRKPTQEEVDALLDKIHASGYDSLTKEEKELLFNAKD